MRIKSGLAVAVAIVGLSFGSVVHAEEEEGNSEAALSVANSFKGNAIGKGSTVVYTSGNETTSCGGCEGRGDSGVGHLDSEKRINEVPNTDVSIVDSAQSLNDD